MTGENGNGTNATVEVYNSPAYPLCVPATYVQGRMCLMLGPPGSGKTTLMKTLAAQLHKTYSSLRFTGSVTYNGKT